MKTYITGRQIKHVSDDGRRHAWYCEVEDIWYVSADSHPDYEWPRKLGNEASAVLWVEGLRP